MKTFKKALKRHLLGDSLRAKSVEVLKRIRKLFFLISLVIFHFSLVTYNCSLSCAESISDIKLDALNQPVKEKWGRDPFIRYEDKIAKLKGKALREDMPVGLKITGIISDGKKAVAIINGGFYRKNERVDNFLIVDIAKDKVSLEKNGKRFYLGVEKFTIDAYKGKDGDELKKKVKTDDKGKDKKDDKEAKE